MQPIKYAQTAWNDIKNSPGWKGKVALLALLQIIPIFGQIVLFGYLFGWARDIAWGIHSPLPAKVFGNEDGKLYSRGFFILVILFVFSLVPGVLSMIASAALGGGAGYSLHYDNYTPGIIGGTLASILGLIGFVASFAILIAFNIAAMRTAIYDRISAGFQLKKLWSMFRYDTNGAMRILGMEILISLIGGIVLSLLASMIFAIFGMALIPGVMALGYDPDLAQILGLAGPSILLFMLVGAAIGFAGAFFSVVVYAMVARASGYWTQQFQVAQWRGQDDPMPFEAAQAASAAQTAQYAAQVQYAQAQAQYAQAQGAQISYANAQAQQQYAQAQAQQLQARQPQPQHVPQPQAQQQYAQPQPQAQQQYAQPQAQQQPVQPAAPTEPVQPAQPAAPTEPVQPAQPATPEIPANPQAPEGDNPPAGV